MPKTIDELAVNSIRFLCAEAVQKAKSGHPGLPLGAAPAAYTLWSKFLKFNPANPDWPDRDRFILSAGHGSTLVYSLLHLFGFGLSVEDLQNFRQWGSLTPGHPEYGHTRGVEVTTGPLGQGIANAVGFAWAESYLGAKFNKPDVKLVDHYTYVLCGDGCLMEGISAEAASLAGTLGLSKLILLYDSNNITIEGDTGIAFRESVQDRFKAYGWHVQLVEDGTDMASIASAIEAAKLSNEPSLIEIKTIIGTGAPNKQGKSSAHGEPLGVDEIVAAKKNLEWDYPESFYVPAEVKEHIVKTLKEKALEEAKWNGLLKEYKEKYPEEYAEWNSWIGMKLPIELLCAKGFWESEGNLATRISSEQVLNKAAAIVPNLIGGSADLAPSTKTIMKGRGDYSKENPQGANLHFGIREHAMTAIANGMALHGGLRPYVAGFFVFSDYMKPAMRLSALMKLPVIYIMTHDSIGVGEDGPTHQPVEHLAALRSIPGFTVARPCDTHETAAAWYLALTRKGPTALVLTRQNLPLLKESGKDALRGAYIVKDSEKEIPDVILIATGSEVQLAYNAVDILKGKGIDARAVSALSLEVFEEQPAEYKEKVLPSSVRARVAIEAGSSFGWHKYVGFDGDVISVDTFGASAPADRLFKEFGFTVENVVAKAEAVVKKLGK
ncbi:MAG: transketolase [Clostridiales bacterium]|jgi:transketolase|nr:transketolase [Clostridiales bacterium]